MKMPYSAMTPQEAYEFSSEMADLWGDQPIEDELWEAQMEAIRAAYQADYWAAEGQARQEDYIQAAKEAEALAYEQRQYWLAEMEEKDEARRRAEIAEA